MVKNPSKLMPKLPKKIWIPLLAVFSLIILAYLTYILMNARTFQLFGSIVHRVETEEKVVALTFDDGPNKNTDRVVDILEDKQVNATFYLVGREMEQLPDVTKRIAETGNEIGNHSYSHQRMIFKSQSFIDNEVQTTNQLIREAGYGGDITFRPPYGKKIVGLPWYLSRHSIETIMVDVEPDTYSPDADSMVANALENTKPGSIILLHPFCDSCDEQRKALPEIIDTLRAEGYRFVTVSELLELRRQ